MKLTLEGISDRKEWEQKGYKLPEYNIEKMRENTKSKPFWIHFGAGNLFRAFHARVVQNMLNVGAIDRGLVVAEGFDYEIIKKMYEPHDNLGLVATLKSDGSIDKDVVASVAEALPLDSADEKATAWLMQRVRQWQMWQQTLRQARISHQAIWARSLHFCTTDMLTEQSLLQW